MRPPASSPSSEYDYTASGEGARRGASRYTPMREDQQMITVDSYQLQQKFDQLGALLARLRRYL